VNLPFIEEDYQEMKQWLEGEGRGRGNYCFLKNYLKIKDLDLK
jgi:hypothetical protein